MTECPGMATPAVGDQNGHGSRRVEREKLLAALPWLQFHEFRFLAILAEDEADETARSQQRMMIQGRHGETHSKQALWKFRGGADKPLSAGFVSPAAIGAGGCADKNPDEAGG